ncbi:MAG: aminodeoxychorismate synthase component I [Solirubrobacterales bacterium]
MPVASQPEAPPASMRPRLLAERLDFMPDPERAFVHIYGASRNAFWLDSGTVGERGRFSFMGDSEGPLGALITYDLERRQVRVERHGEAVELRDESIFDYLERELGLLRQAESGLPFDFECGFAGYLGYELKAECEAIAAHSAPTPDAAFIQADRLIAFDRQERHAYLLVLVPAAHRTCLPRGRQSDAPERWIEETARQLISLPALDEPPPSMVAAELVLRRSPERYREDVIACKRFLEAGHSYEICLTNKAVAEAPLEPLDLYRALRRVNPAPFSAYLRFGDLAVLSSSPERFLSIDREGRAEARPIKGTSRRAESGEEDARLAAALGSDAKNRAENVTIVDLVRNDLGRVCAIGSVEVPELMGVETYETVHQLVSAVRGRLRPEVGISEAIRACFPPGSMTGAPKLRTMEIIDELEGEARGVYSGAIGYLGPGGGCDLSVAIRTIVLDAGKMTIGAGGAIVADSDPERELDEMLLKAAAPAAALGSGTSISFASAAAPTYSRRRPTSPTPS